ncbi:MAG TPA: ATPase, T2SS/T4P/T4SS family, partial [Acidimicrobiia bacterium]|nr:ATPase, T2SS/T4P/T4SS family [Acidimicrobiia bacterium]
MKLSDRLNAIDADFPAKPEPRPARPKPTPRPADTETPPDFVPEVVEEAPRPAPRPRRATADWEETKRRVHELVLTDVGPRLSKSHSGDGIEKEVKASLDRMLQREDVRISPVERRKFISEVMSDILGYGPLDAPLADPSITEIMCNGYDAIWVERAGVIEPTDLCFTDESQFRQVIDKIVTGVGRRIDESSPMVDARLPDGSRVNAIVPPLAIGGPVLTIRKFAEDPYTAKDLINFGSMSMDLALFLEACVRGKLNVLVSGGTGTGKTTTL